MCYKDESVSYQLLRYALHYLCPVPVRGAAVRGTVCGRLFVEFISISQYCGGDSNSMSAVHVMIRGNGQLIIQTACSGVL